MSIKFIFVFAIIVIIVLTKFISRRRATLHNKYSDASKAQTPKKIYEIPLEALASIWVTTGAATEEDKATQSNSTKSVTLEASVVSSQSNTSLRTEGKVLTSMSEKTAKFYAEAIQPYEKEIEAQKATDIIRELIRIIEEHGNCPSIVFSGADKESFTMQVSVKEIFGKVTLIDHTFQVVLKLIELVKEVYADGIRQVPKAIVVGLAHDIGKIPEFHMGHYSTQDHPLISESKLREIVLRLKESGKETPYWIDQAYIVVKEHHLPGSKDQLVELLKKADRESRALELAGHMKEYRISVFDEWFEPEELVKRLEPYINVMQTNKWYAVSNGNVVYVRPDFLVKLTNDLREDKKVLDSLFLYTTNTTTVMKNVIAKLRERDLTAPILKEGYSSIRCKVITDITRTTGRSHESSFTPLRLDAISKISGVSISELESRKLSSSLQVIIIEPVIG